MKIRTIWLIACNLKVVVSILDSAIVELSNSGQDLIDVGDAEDRYIGGRFLSDAEIASTIVESYTGV